MEKPMDDIINIDVNPMSSIPWKGIRYLISMDDIDKDDHLTLSSIAFDEKKNIAGIPESSIPGGQTKTGTAQ